MAGGGAARAGRAGHRVGRAPGGDRQLSAPACVSRLVRGAREALAAPARGAPPRHAWRGRLRRPAWRVPLCGGRQGRAARLRRGLHRQQGRLAAHRHRAVLAARARHARRLQGRGLRGAAHQPAHQSAEEPGRADAHRERGAGVPSDLSLRRRGRSRGGSHPRERRHARRRRAAQQFPAPRAAVESRRRAEGRYPRDPRRALRVRRGGCGHRGRRPRRSAAAAPRRPGRDRRRARERAAVPLPLRRERRGPRGDRRDAAGEGAPCRRRARGSRRRAARLRGANLRLRRGGRGRACDRRRREARGPAALREIQRRREDRRRARRDRGLDQRFAVRVRGGRAQRPQGDPAHRARYPAALLRLQPRAAPAAHRLARYRFTRHRFGERPGS